MMISRGVGSSRNDVKINIVECEIRLRLIF